MLAVSSPPLASTDAGSLLLKFPVLDWEVLTDCQHRLVCCLPARIRSAARFNVSVLNVASPILPIEKFVDGLKALVALDVVV